jgi:hypothetical protein
MNHSGVCNRSYCSLHAPHHPCNVCSHYSQPEKRCNADYKSVKAICPHCNLSFCEAHLKNHNIQKIRKIPTTVTCNDVRRGGLSHNYAANQTKCVNCASTTTEICQFCFKWHCSKHQSHSIPHENNTPYLEKCSGYESIKEKDLLLGKIPEWTFQNHCICLGNPRPKILTRSLTPHLILDLSEEYPFPVFDVGYLDNFNFRDKEMLKNELVISSLKPFVNTCELCNLEKMSARECLALLKTAGHLDVLYKAFLNCQLAKLESFNVLKIILKDMKNEEKLAKQSIDDIFLFGEKMSMYEYIELDDFEDYPETTPVLHEKMWSKKVLKLTGTIPKNTSKVPESERLPLCILDLTGKHISWFKAMTAMKAIRKRINLYHAKHFSSIWHLSILEFGECQVFAVNHKDYSGAGTTRILFPITTNLGVLKKDHSRHKDSKIRVLDLSYGEIHRIIQYNLLPVCKYNDSVLAQCMLDVLENKTEKIEEMMVPVKLGKQRCAFLKGVRLNGNGEMEMDKIWWLSRKAPALDVDELGAKFTLYQVICNILAILFIAEPRHSLAMHPATIFLLKEIVDKRLTFVQMFSSLNDTIKHGRLLPGANVLGPALGEKDKTVKFKAQETLEKIAKEINPKFNNFPQTLIKCSFKPFAMPLADSPLYTIDMEKFDHSPNILEAIEKPEIAILPVCEPAMKVLFAIFLRTIGEAPKCKHIIKKNELKTPESLDKKEEQEKQENIEDKDVED